MRSRTRRFARPPFALRLPVVGALATALVVGPAAITAQGDPAEPIEASMESVAVAGVDQQALEDTAGVEFNTPAAEPRARTSGPDDEETGHRPVEPDDDRLVALTKKHRTRNFTALGLTWEGEQEPVSVWVRTKNRGAKWSDWELVPSGTEHAPDPGSREATDRTRAGTEPLIVPESDGVQVRVEAEDRTAPRGMQVDLIDPKQAEQDALVQEEPIPAGRAVADGTTPEIIPRAQWGADESLRRGDPSYDTVRGGFIHHTDTTNDYSRSEVAAQIRAIYTFHVEGRGWDDIGYNFLIDRFGRTFEGRYGGVEKPVVGAHTLGYNSQAFGASVLGNHQSLAANNAVIEASADLFAWKLALHGVDASSMVNLHDERFHAISGHRDGFATLCPGDALYAQLPTIRQRAHDRQPELDPTPFPDVTSYTTNFTHEIAWLKEEGITTGYSDGTFGPKDQISREAVAAFLYRAAGRPATDGEGPDFSDVDSTSSFATQIAWLQDEGITTGYADGTFRPKGKISREALAAFLSRAVLDGPPPSSTAPYEFSDVEGTQFADHIAWLADEGITTGYADGTFGPRDRITREATAAFLYRARDLTATAAVR